MKKEWNKREIDFLKAYYPHKGIQYCAKRLNRSKASILGKCCRLNLQITPERRSKNAKQKHYKRDYYKNKIFSVPVKQFRNIRTKEIAYILGFLWADGYVFNRGKGFSNYISLECLLSDILQIKPIFEKTGKWNFYVRDHKNRKNTAKLTTNNRPLVEWLVSLDYVPRCTKAPIRVLQQIPKHLKHYFFRGLIDGDGCFYVNKENKSYQFGISSNFDQDWSSVIHLFEELKIQYNIHRRTVKNNKHSYIHITNKKGINLLGNYLYNGYDKDKIGLERKYKKFLAIRECYKPSDL